jgi:hypothetical protein
MKPKSKLKLKYSPDTKGIAIPVLFLLESKKVGVAFKEHIIE